MTPLRNENQPRTAGGLRSNWTSGVTMVELLVASGIFLIFLTGVFAMLVSGVRAHRAAEDQSLRIQETEAVVHLINYEVGLAGYTRTESPASFSDASGSTITVELGSGGESDRMQIRFFEDPDFLAGGDTGERLVEYRVGSGNDFLERVDLVSGAVEELVGGVQGMRVVEFIGRNRDTLSQAEAQDPATDIAGVRFTVNFTDGTEWTFLVGLYNRQRVSIVGSSG